MFSPDACVGMPDKPTQASGLNIIHERFAWKPNSGTDSPMPYLLDIVYLLLLIFFSPWLVWQSFRTGKYREGFAEKFLGRVPLRTSQEKCLWFHAVSVGEVNLIAPLLRIIERAQPDWQCVVSTTTRSGMALARKKYPHLTRYSIALWTLVWAVRTASVCRIIRPDAVGSGSSWNCGPIW